MCRVPKQFSKSDNDNVDYVRDKKLSYMTSAEFKIKFCPGVCPSVCVKLTDLQKRFPRACNCGHTITIKAPVILSGFRDRHIGSVLHCTRIICLPQVQAYVHT